MLYLRWKHKDVFFPLSGEQNCCLLFVPQNSYAISCTFSQNILRPNIPNLFLYYKVSYVKYHKYYLIICKTREKAFFSVQIRNKLVHLLFLYFGNSFIDSSICIIYIMIKKLCKNTSFKKHDSAIKLFFKRFLIALNNGMINLTKLTYFG